MNTLPKLKLILLASAIACAACCQAGAAIITNGGFESGFTGWTRTDQVGSDGAFALQTGVASPVNLDPVPAPPGGVTAAMSDAAGPGSHVLLQSFTVAAALPSAQLSFDVFIGNRAGAFSIPTPASLDFSTPALNQQARVDILLGSAGAFSVAPADLLLNVYQTHVGDPLISGYTHITADITAVINAHLNTALTLRFAEVDNVNTFQMGVDNVDIAAPSTDVPEPSSALLALGALLCGAGFSLRRASARSTPLS